MREGRVWPEGEFMGYEPIWDSTNMLKGVLGLR